MHYPPPITNAEWVVMKLIWARPSATAPEVVKALENKTSWNHVLKSIGLARCVRYQPFVTDPETRGLLEECKRTMGVGRRALEISETAGEPQSVATTD